MDLKNGCSIHDSQNKPMVVWFVASQLRELGCISTFGLGIGFLEGIKRGKVTKFEVKERAEA